jgi:hypothetical protein
VFQHCFDPLVSRVHTGSTAYLSANVRTALKINKHKLEQRRINKVRAAKETELSLRAEIVQHQKGEDQ